MTLLRPAALQRLLPVMPARQTHGFRPTAIIRKPVPTVSPTAGFRGATDMGGVLLRCSTLNDRCPRLQTRALDP